MTDIAYFLHNHYLSHPLLALGLQVIVASLLMRRNIPMAWWIGAAFAIGMYYGRERRDCEVARNFNAVSEWYRCWSPTDFTLDNHWDFWPVVFACLALGIFASWRERRRELVGLGERL